MASIIAPTLPRSILIRQYGDVGSVAATGLSALFDPVYYDSVLGMYNPMGRIEIEEAKVDSRYVHLRFSHTNKYWSCNNPEEGYVVAWSGETEEDVSNPSCTLFEPVSAAAGGAAFHLVHVHSGSRVMLDGTLKQIRFVVRYGASSTDTFASVDWDTIVRLPRNVAFKGDTGKYLRVYKHVDDTLKLEFSSDDPTDEKSIQQVELQPDGSVRIKSTYTGGYWGLQGDWVAPNSKSDTADTRYLPLKGKDNTIALKNVGNGFFCKRLTAEGFTSMLNAGATTMTKEARMEVQELVSERKIYNVTYRKDEARIYNERPYVAGESKLRNDTDQVATQSVAITYEDTKSYTFSRGFSVTAGVSTTIEAGVPFVAKGEINVALEITGSFQWDTTTTTRTSVTDTGTVSVPPKSTIVVKYVGTQGTCSLPYTYTQQDRSSTDGQVLNIQQTDGIYHGVSCYNFDFHMDEAVPL